MNFATMAHADALFILVSLDTSKWWLGEKDREALRVIHACKSRGRLIRAIAYHPLNNFGDSLSEDKKKVVNAQLTEADYK